MGNATRAGMIIEYAGREYEVSPLGLRELEFLETFVQGQIIAAGRSSIPEDLPQAEKDALMRPIVAIAMETTIMGQGGFNKLQTPAGIVRLFHASLKAKSPDVTLEDCRKMMLNPEVAQQIKDAVKLLNPNPKEGAVKNPPAPPTPVVGGEQLSVKSESSSP